jgi:hypothetical protein
MPEEGIIDLYCDIMKNTKYHTVGTIPKSIKTIVERVKIETPNNTQIHDRSLSWLDTGTSITSGGVKLVYCIDL